VGHSWPAALQVLDRHPWHQFEPVESHADFKRLILAAVAERFRRGRGGKLKVIVQWLQLCGKGDRRLPAANPNLIPPFLRRAV
jgi:hypothetical protein